MQHPDEIAPPLRAPRFHLNPRTVPEFLHNFKVAVEEHFNTEDPGRTENYYCVGIFVSPRGNKRQLKIYIIHSPLASERKVTTMDYVMPVAPEFADTFGSPIARVLPSRGPNMHAHTLVGGETVKDFIYRTVGPLAEPENRMSPWSREMAHAQRIRNSPDQPESRRDNAGRFFAYWSAMYEPIMRTLGAAGIHVPHEDGQLSPAWRSPARAASPAEAPALPTRSSSATRRRRSSERRRRRLTSRKKNSDPTNIRPSERYNTDPVTGKKLRRRRPNSDPKDD
jgi:hypothetical protein